MKLTTVGELKDILTSVPNDTKILHCCDHAGIVSYHLGYNLSLTIQAIKKSSLPGFGYVKTSLDDPEAEKGIIL